MTPANPSRRWQYLLAVLVAGYLVVCVLVPKLFVLLGVNHYPTYFLDTFALLASNDAVTAGLDPYKYNPFDPLHRPHVYSHWWLYLRDLGLTRADTWWLGGTILLAFLATALARLRPASPRELLWQFAVFSSPCILLALERGNNDLVVFLVLAPVVPCLLASRRLVRLIPAGLVAVAMGLKFYPAVAGLVLLAGAGDARETRLRVIFAGALLVIVFVNVHEDMVRFASIGPKAIGFMTFGAINFPEELGLAPDAAKRFVLATLVGLVLVAGMARRRIFAGWAGPGPHRAEWLYFILGSVLLTGCFFAGTNYGYRWIFALWMAPWLWRLAHDTSAPAALRRLTVVTMVSLLAATWVTPFLRVVLLSFRGDIPIERLAEWAHPILQLEGWYVWILFPCLLVFLVHFTLEELVRLRPGAKNLSRDSVLSPTS